ncbi:hypothetical protein F0562_002907 [Nyssa sinensis]|uniref:Uncharacterized protein n=1 Tax=Nyssa sinensis TaxID=561372 RepID=A0A5J5BUQ0_9ASTE|nr:hypothetical protein F0562_002907 [Nyssa sinensis]
MLCSQSSIKDVHLPKWQDRSASFSDDPSSPKISCMGQIKRNNKVIAYPTSHRFTTTATKTIHNNIKYSKLKKLFSGKNLIATTTTSSCSRKEMIINDENHHYIPINVVDMDPPLPVVKRVQDPAAVEGRDDVNLWKRRSSGVALKSLQIQQIHDTRPGAEISVSRREWN